MRDAVETVFRLLELIMSKTSPTTKKKKKKKKGGKEERKKLKPCGISRNVHHHQPEKAIYISDWLQVAES